MTTRQRGGPVRPPGRPGRRTEPVAASASASAFELAEAVIRRSDREHPADDRLRQVLRESRAVTPKQARLVSGAVFAYYRWRGWLDPEQPLSQQLAQALDLARGFARDPMGIPEADLRARAIPSWVASELEVTEGWLRHLQTEPPLWLRARVGGGVRLARELDHCRPAGTGRLADALRYQGREDLFRSAAFHRGDFEIQDLHSQAVGWLCDPQPGETWWDACAGEGGKTLHLAELMRNRGLIWATDRAAWRLDRLRRRAARARVFNYRARGWDGAAARPFRTPCDGVLVDAPCSNLGTWQRNPQARWTTTPADVRELAIRQLDLLTNVVAALRPGGRLFYAVCTLTRAETTGVAEALARGQPDLEPMPLVHPLCPEAPARSELWLDPGATGANGMFVAAWRRKAAVS
ncbi:MAG TPA: RsmB/NOP family class I SAM-dependent RNA methyltransferase [Verrucomicrobiota bacterium]|nr:RsmB/NOP family class I SAM-dependent RNA methyltransferase [Verrucomicrobiota bacterium]HNU52687.1 RsmB/NOP family class I SAM-dependent RNA methyltransferase [Verrucomicrobiota bacterium]